jgi:ketosteroid isomerase-like protein
MPMQNNSQKEEDEILRNIESFNESFLKNDTEKYFSFITDDFSLFVPNSPYRIDGKILDREEFEYSLKTGKSRVWLFQMLQPRVQIFGNTAVVSFYSRGSFGTSVNESGISFYKITDVLAKENNNWKIVHIHVSK